VAKERPTKGQRKANRKKALERQALARDHHLMLMLVVRYMHPCGGSAYLTVARASG